MLKSWYKLIDKHGERKVYLLTYLLIIGVLSIFLNILMAGGLFHSSILYIFVPFIISALVTMMRKKEPAKTATGSYFSHLITALTIFLSSAMLIGEGFVCVIFIIPIYVIIVTISYLASLIFSDKDKKYSLAFPALIVALSLEGTIPSLSLPRDTFIEVKQSTVLSVDEIKANLAKPFDLNKDRNWLLSIFPMPYHIEAGSLEPGDIHTIHTRYHRWIFTNTHEGKAELLIESVGENKIKTRVLNDSTYFSTYLNGAGSEIDLQPNATGGTDITLRISYRRNLDPAWYFHPLQQYGVSKMGELLIKELMIREDTHSTKILTTHAPTHNVEKIVSQ